MARPVFHSDLGGFFRDLRESRGWSLRQTATIAKNRQFKRVSYQALQRLEAGKVKNPEPELLKAVASLYGVEYRHLVDRWVAHVFGLNSDLVRQDPAQQSPLHERGSDVPASAETEARRLEAKYHELANATATIASQLFNLAAAHGADNESLSARDAQPGARRRARKAGR